MYETEIPEGEDTENWGKQYQKNTKFSPKLSVDNR
jgi:hypothetical protein